MISKIVATLTKLIGFALHIVNIGSNVATAIQYFEEGDPKWGYLTIAFTFLPWVSYFGMVYGLRKKGVEEFQSPRSFLLCFGIFPVYFEFKSLIADWKGDDTESKKYSALGSYFRGSFTLNCPF